MTNKCDRKIEICLGKDEKHCGKRRKPSLPAFADFLKMFSKVSFLGSLKVGIVWERVRVIFPLLNSDHGHLDFNADASIQ